ncbi:MAG: GIY-YIG nuclease family protein [Betaproteobacteria bacterium]|nr:GIY-YIG nuclease family protein [Betaproteobacteria bacterium]
MRPFLHSSLAVVDLETTGTAATGDAITEVAIVSIEDGHVVEEWSSLVNPGTTIPPEIVALTGISDAMVANAPAFGDIADQVLARLAGKLFVAHNARFDYAFLKNAFRRAGKPFSADVLCTVRLSRRLFPEFHKHSLDDLVARHQLDAPSPRPPPALAGEGEKHDAYRVSAMRHRALGDARLAWQFMQRVVESKPTEEIAAATKYLLKMPSFPPQLDAAALENLPDGPGVYVFYGINNLPIYIGKSVNLKDRVRSHFSSDHRNSNDVRLSMEVRRIDFEETAGEFGALLRESQLIKTAKPLRNIRLRKQAAMVFVQFGAVDQPHTFVPVDEADVDAPEQTGTLFGPFSTKALAKAHLVRLAGDAQLCWHALHQTAPGAPCFARQLKRCAGFCVGEETLAAHNTRLIAALADRAFPVWPFTGPIAIAETHPDHGWQRAHVFDHWRYLGSARDEDEVHALAATRVDTAFDADIFKLVAKALGEGRAVRVLRRADG